MTFPPRKNEFKTSSERRILDQTVLSFYVIPLILRVILFTVAFHMTFSVVRVTASLDALSHGYGSFTVGLLISLLALFPTFLSMPWGRVVDRVGARLPIAVGGLFLLAGVMIRLSFRRLISVSHRSPFPAPSPVSA